ncbi:MAG TPA: response regulator [Methylovorus sp.]|jgi:two-component system, OmpR family, KDP operon response regulator KdpE|nr:response regulator [Methylovorus sp.]
MTSTATVILIEDELQIQRFVQAALEEAGFTVYSTDSGKQGVIDCGTRKPDAVILDLGLPDMDGIDVIRQIRSWSHVPVIVLSARTQEAQKVSALDAGADDYLTKPFGTAELLARIRAQLRRQSRAGTATQESIFTIGNIQVDLANREVRRGDALVSLTPIEFRLLAALIRYAGRVVTQRQLLKEVWGPSHIESGHYVRIYMGHLRHKLEADPAQPRYLLTETGVGYRLLTDAD